MTKGVVEVPEGMVPWVVLMLDEETGELRLSWTQVKPEAYVADGLYLAAQHMQRALRGGHDIVRPD